MLRRATWVALGLACAASAACQDPTQIRLRVMTKGITCGDGTAQVGSTVLLSGRSASELSEEVVTERCATRDGGADIGDLTYIPRGDDEARFTVEVYMGLDGRRAETCSADCGAGCIRASRRMSFVPQQKLLMTIVGDLACDGICCEDETTCVDGACVSNEIAPCADGDPGCGEPGTGGGGTGGGEPTVARAAVRAVDVRLDSNVVPFLVGHAEGGVHREGFIAPLPPPDEDPKEVRCASSGGDVTMISAVPDDGRVHALGTWAGTQPLICRDEEGVIAQLETTLPGHAFIFTQSLRENEGARLELVASWPLEAQVELSDVAVVSDTQVLVVGYLDGTLEPATASDQIVDRGLLLIPFQRDAQTGLSPRDARVFSSTTPLTNVHAVGRLDEVGAVIAMGIRDGTMAVGFNGSSNIVGKDGAQSVVAIVGDNFAQPAAQPLTTVQIEAVTGDIALDDLGYLGNQGDGLALLALRHTGDVLRSGTPPIVGPGCTLVPVRIDGTPDNLGPTALGPCQRILAGRSRRGDPRQLAARRVGDSWIFSWPDAGASTQGASLELSESVTPVGLFQLADTGQLFVAGHALEQGHLDSNAFPLCDAERLDFIWGDSGLRPFVRCYASP